MFDFISKSIKKVFGTKYDRDSAVYSPRVAEINEAFEGLSNVSNDELRNKTVDFRQRIAEHLAGIDQDIREAKEQATAEADLNSKEALFAEID